MVMCYIIIASVVLVEVIARCLVQFYLGNKSHFGLVRTSDVKSSTMVYVEELEGLPEDISLWRKKGQKKPKVKN